MNVKVMFFETCSHRKGLKPVVLARYSAKRYARKLIVKWAEAAQGKHHLVVANLNCCTIYYEKGCFMLWIETEK